MMLILMCFCRGSRNFLVYDGMRMVTRSAVDFPAWVRHFEAEASGAG